MKIFKKSFISALSFMGLSLVGCSQYENFESMATNMASDEVPTVKPGEFDLDTLVLLDSRAREEFEVSHIQGARYVGYNDFDISTIADIPRDQPILIYCSVGYRSGKIGEKLQKAGYTNVQNLYGGIFHWMNEGLPVYKADTVTNQIHPYNEKWGKWLEKGEKVYE